jgi:H+/gluconate symporter-like permease
MTVTQTFKSWTAMKVIESVVGLGIVVAIHTLVP